MQVLGPFITVLEQSLYRKFSLSHQDNSTHSPLTDKSVLINQEMFYWIWITIHNNKFVISAENARDLDVLPEYNSDERLQILTHQIANSYKLPRENAHQIFHFSKSKKITQFPVVLNLFEPNHQKYYCLGITQHALCFFKTHRLHTQDQIVLIENLSFGLNNYSLRMNQPYNHDGTRVFDITVNDFAKLSSLKGSDFDKKNRFIAMYQAWKNNKIQSLSPGFKNLLLALNDNNHDFTEDDLHDLIILIEGILNNDQNYEQNRIFLSIIKYSGWQHQLFPELSHLLFILQVKLIISNNDVLTTEQINRLSEQFESFSQFAEICNLLGERKESFITGLNPHKIKSIINTFYELEYVLQILESQESATDEFINTFVDFELASIIASFENESSFKIFDLIPSDRVAAILIECCDSNPFFSNIKTFTELVKSLSQSNKRAIIHPDVLQVVFSESTIKDIHSCLKNSNIYKNTELKDIFLDSLEQIILSLLQNPSSITDICYLIDIYEEKIIHFDYIRSFLLNYTDSPQKFCVLFREVCRGNISTENPEMSAYTFFSSESNSLAKSEVLFSIFFPEKIKELILDEYNIINETHKSLIYSCLNQNQKNQVQILLDYETNISRSINFNC